MPTLEALSRAEMRMIVVSNWDYSLHRILRNLGISEFFEHEFASLEHGPEKPDPEFFRIAGATTGLPLDAILHVGDHPLDDLEGARGAGLQALLLDRDREEMHVPFISSLRDVLKLLSLGDR